MSTVAQRVWPPGLGGNKFQLFFIVLVAATIICGLGLYQMIMNDAKETSKLKLIGQPKEQSIAVKHDYKIVLYWTNTTTKIDFYPFIFNDKGTLRNCAGGIKCYTTNNKSLLAESHAVVFHGFQRSLPYDIPTALKSNPQRINQYWIYLNRESPSRTPIMDLTMPVFNWTMTYKLSSDIVYNYFRILPGKYKEGFDSGRNYLEGKNGTAIVLISNCYKPRLEFVKELQKYIDVDLFGRCGKSCGSRTDCIDRIKYYKFYLSLENSLCADYITEKVYFNAFVNTAIPVVVSGANLSNPLILPQRSYIDGRKFDNLKELSKYLKYIGSNNTLYNSYFQWRANWTILSQDAYKSPQCSICEMLYKSNQTKMKYNDIYSWFDKRKDCIEWDTVLKMI